MRLTIITPHKKLVDGEDTKELFVPGIEGQLNVLPEHAAFVTELETGILKWKTASNYKSAIISHGWMQVENENVTVLADVSELSEEIDVIRAKSAESKARQKIEEGGLNDDDFRKFELKLKRSLARQSAGQE